MAWIKNMKWIGSLIVLIGILTACSVSYKFNGASIDYAKTKTISFENFPNRSVGLFGDRWRICSTLHCKMFICSKRV